MKRLLAAMLAVLMLTLCGCNSVIIENGTLRLVANDIDHIVITNGLTGNSFSIAERDSIGTIVSHLNSYTLENGTNSESTDHFPCYCITLVDRTNGGAESHYYIPDNETILIDGTAFIINAKELRQYLESLECKTLTDNELIDTLLASDILNQLNITDEEGKISIDKIISLPKSCPMLFELLSRPSAIQSISSYGVDQFNAYLNSANPEMVEKAQEWIEILKQLLPEVQEKLENLLKNQEKSVNNP